MYFNITDKRVEVLMKVVTVLLEELWSQLSKESKDIIKDITLRDFRKETQ